MTLATMELKTRESLQSSSSVTDSGPNWKDQGANATANSKLKFDLEDLKKCDREHVPQPHHDDEAEMLKETSRRAMEQP